MALTWRQRRVYTHRFTVWRESETRDGTGKPSRTWAIVATGVAAHIQPNPSQFELQEFMLSEGDNIFTLDILHFEAAADVEAGDVLKLTTGHAKLLGGFWKVRGATQALTLHANKQRFVSARLPGPPEGVS